MIDLAFGVRTKTARAGAADGPMLGFRVATTLPSDHERQCLEAPMSRFVAVVLMSAGCGRIGFTSAGDASFDDTAVDVDVDGAVVTGCAGNALYATASAAAPSGEYTMEIQATAASCTFVVVVAGAGGGASTSARPGGAGGRNSFVFSPGESGVLRIVVGGGGGLAPDNHGAPGGGASSLLFDPSADPSTADSYTLAIAGGGGGGGLAGILSGGAGNGSGAGQDSDSGGGAPGDGTGGPTDGETGAACDVPCQGGRGGDSNGDFGNVVAGSGKGVGVGASYFFGGGGGGGFGGGGAPRFGRGGGGGAGKVFTVMSPATQMDTTISGVGNGGFGGVIGSGPGADGTVEIVVR